jgi:hypothetical protein
MKVYFYSPIANDTLKKLDSFDDLIYQTRRGLEIWIHITYYMLLHKSKLIEPILTQEIPDEGIVVFHKGFSPKEIKPNKNQYFICVQADYGRHKFAQMHLVQNPYQVSNFKLSRRSFFDNTFSFSSSNYITLWPQPSIIKRSLDRNISINNISFYGNIEQVEKGLEEYLTGFCKKNGLQYTPKYDPLSWNDYSSTDITLAIRSFDNNSYYHKPFSKLVNAVIADCLVIAAPESSSLFFKEKYFPKLPIVDSIDGLSREINNIIKYPDIYFEHLNACKNRINELVDDGVVSQWEHMLFVANNQFLNWKNSSPITRSIFLNYRSL